MLFVSGLLVVAVAIKPCNGSALNNVVLLRWLRASEGWERKRYRAAGVAVRAVVIDGAMGRWFTGAAPACQLAIVKAFANLTLRNARRRAMRAHAARTRDAAQH
jgi:hypothetical protein